MGQSAMKREDVANTELMMTMISFQLMRRRKKRPFVEEGKRKRIGNDEKIKDEKREAVMIITMKMRLMNRANGINIRKYLVMRVVVHMVMTVHAMKARSI